MLSGKIIELLDSQVNKEFFSSYQYLAMAHYCDSIGFEGAAHWMKKQSREEYEHAQKILNYLEDQQVCPTLKAIVQPVLSFASLLTMFENALLAEKSVTQSINQIASVALGENDHATYAFVQWFVTEQVEEEKSTQRIVDTLKLLEQNTGLLYAFDKELGKR